MRSMTQIAHLPDRAVLAVTGSDRVGFLNGLVSNDIELAAPARCVWAALLTPQGKWLADFFVFAEADRLLLDVEASQASMVVLRLSRFRLRADVAIAPVPLLVHLAWDGEADAAGATHAPDPRLEAAGTRVLAGAPLATNADAATWDLHRLGLGLPDGSRDLESEKTVLLEAGFDELHGISWTKGCYMGQELTARTRYRGLVKRRLVQAHAEGRLPPHGTPVMAGDREVGQLRSSRDGIGLAAVRIDALGEPATADGHPVTLALPAWARLPQAA